MQTGAPIMADEEQRTADTQNDSLQQSQPPAADQPTAPDSGVPIPKSAPPVVAIGASAGGLEALKELFAHMPLDTGMCFVIVTHVQPNRESLLPELLAAVTRLPVVPSEHSIHLEPNTIVVAKDSLLAISDGTLRHAESDFVPETAHHPIDHFFRELAADQKERAVCIVLSGSGNDGTLGLKAIKAAGGMVMVQDPQTAKNDGMPSAAQATNMADYVLAPAEMPAAMVAFSRRAHKVVQPERPLLPEDAVHGILLRLRAHTGQDFTGYKKNTISRRIERRMNVHHIDEPQAYLRYLYDNPRELNALQQELLISVTGFFRDPEAYNALEKALQGLLAGRKEGHPFRVWIPGCATGEEAYSIAILLEEQVRRAGRNYTFQIFATDLDDRAIETARAGLYPEGIAADISPERLQQFFAREEGAYRVHKGIRESVVFAVQNITSDPPFTRIDFIVCRNLLIYLDAAAQRRVFAAFHYALRPGGLLFLGTSETPGEAGRMFDSLDVRNKILRRREVAEPIHPALMNSVNRSSRHIGAEEKQGPSTSTDFNRSIERLLLNQFVPCSIVAEDRGNILYVFGRSGLYLEPTQGSPRNNVVEMAREGLAGILPKALRDAREMNQEVVRRGIRVRTNGDYAATDLSVRPLTAPESLRGLLLITLQPSQPVVAKAVPEPAGLPGQEAANSDLQQTRETLQSTIEELQTTNEELLSSNEELQSVNEELQSANEEMESSKEELQSVNEELSTVNAELQGKILALALAGDDMANLLNSTQIATIFLDRELRVKRYTRQARDVIRLIESDVGRPLSDLTSSLDYVGLVEDCRTVLANLIPREKEVYDTDGKWHQVRLMPYRTSENVIDGVVITIVDIDRTKKAELKAQIGLQYFESIVQTVREPLVVLDSDFRVASANLAFYGVFALQPGQVERKLIYEINGREWDIPELRTLLEDILPSQSVMIDFCVECNFSRIGWRKFLLNARLVQQGEKEQRGLILLAFEDITGRTIQ
jgi:two-component system CheB/CheR fusion protein